MPLRVRLVERIHIVPEPVAFARVRAALVRRDEVQRRAVGRPRRLRHARRVLRQGSSVAARGRLQEELLVAVAPSSDERDRAAIRRPAGRGRTAVLGGQLDGRAAADGLPPDLADRTVCLPVRSRQRVDHGLAVRGELRIEQPGDAREIDDGHGLRGRPLGTRRGRDERQGSADHEGETPHWPAEYHLAIRDAPNSGARGCALVPGYAPVVAAA